ncbi:MAG: ABC transporter ATP-binding protein [Kiritimatiellae bacterium]|nr:ABC transporter ATP-binding protein [Kiritimatiellia bacterium]
MNEIFSRIKVSGRQVATVVAFVVVASVAQMAIPSMLGAMIDKGVGEGRAGLVAGIAVAMVVLSVVACAVNIAAARLAASVTTKFSADLRAELFHKVQTFSAAEIDKFGTASLITRNTTDVTTIQTFATQLLGLGLMAPLMAAVGLALSVAFAGRIAVVIAVAVPVLIVVVTFLIVRASSFSIKLRRKIDDINRLFLETLEGVRVIRAFNRQAHETARFGATNDDTARISRSAVAISGLMMPTVVMLFGATSVGAAACRRLAPPPARNPIHAGIPSGSQIHGTALSRSRHGRSVSLRRLRAPRAPTPAAPCRPPLVGGPGRQRTAPLRFVGQPAVNSSCPTVFDFRFHRV